MNWMEFTAINDTLLLVNISNVSAIREYSADRTDLVLVGGYTYEVQGSYITILKRLQEMENKTLIRPVE